MKEQLEFNQVYATHKNGIYRLCKMLVYNQENVEDLFQEAITNIWKSLKSFKGASKIETWIYRIVVNTSITFNNKQVKRREHEEKYFSSMPSTDSKSGLNDEIYEAVETLEAADKAVVGLYLEGFSYKEIAETLGISVTNVGVKINRIKLKLKNIIKH